jgi:hypothetical protein
VSGCYAWRKCESKLKGVFNNIEALYWQHKVLAASSLMHHIRNMGYDGAERKVNQYDKN